MSWLKSFLRAEEGMTLIELLIAMTVMSIGIAALVAGFSSGVVSINRARVTSTAGALADQQMETFRQGSFAAVVSKAGAPGPDGTYWIQSDVSLCSASVGPAASCSDIPASRPVKLVTITVREAPPPARILFTETSTFDASTG